MSLIILILWKSCLLYIIQISLGISAWEALMTVSLNLLSGMMGSQCEAPRGSRNMILTGCFTFELKRRSPPTPLSPGVRHTCFMVSPLSQHSRALTVWERRKTHYQGLEFRKVSSQWMWPSPESLENWATSFCFSYSFQNPSTALADQQIACSKWLNMHGLVLKESW